MILINQELYNMHAFILRFVVMLMSQGSSVHSLGEIYDDKESLRSFAITTDDSARKI